MRWTKAVWLFAIGALFALIAPSVAAAQRRYYVVLGDGAGLKPTELIVMRPARSVLSSTASPIARG